MSNDRIQSDAIKGLTFYLNGEGRLEVEFFPIDERRQHNARDFKLALSATPWSGFFIDEGARTEALRAINSQEVFRLVVGERRDGSVQVTVAPDGLQAYLSVYPAYGGHPATEAMARKAMAEARIVYGLDEETLAHISYQGAMPAEYLVAQGDAPRPGVAGELVKLLADATERGPRCDENGVCDLREIGGVPSVAAGTPLMRRIPPVEGLSGKNVRGEVIPVLPPKDAQFAPGLQGVRLVDGDPDLLVAAISGQPVAVTNGIMVEPLIKLKNVDMSTGNLTFDGAVEIEGNIREGMTVRATGDIVVKGLIEAANVETEGNLEVAGGIIGTPDGDFMISAKGNVTCAFAEHAKIFAFQDVLIKGNAIQSNIAAGGTIVVGENGTQGRIIGGTLHAALRVKAAIAGSPAGLHTNVRAGTDPSASRKLQIAQEKLAERTIGKDELQKRVMYLQEKGAPETLVASVNKLLAKLDTEITELVSEKKRLQKRLECQTEGALVLVEKSVYAGTHVSVGMKQLLLQADHGGMAFRNLPEMEELSMEPL